MNTISTIHPNIDRVSAAVHAALQREIQVIVDEEAVNAAARVESRVKERATHIAGRVLEKFSMQQFGSTLRIEVDFSPKA